MQYVQHRGKVSNIMLIFRM